MPARDWRAAAGIGCIGVMADWLNLFNARKRSGSTFKGLSRKDAILRSYLFDGVWYLSMYRHLDADMGDPLDHYLKHGSKRGLFPNPLFDPKWYRQQNPDVAASGMEPLEHYIRHGSQDVRKGRRSRNPHPLFSSDWYLRHNEGARASSLTPLAHYLAFGGMERTDPHPLFVTTWYDGQNPDDAKLGRNPLISFMQSWRERLSDPCPLFDIRFFLDQNPELVNGAVDPLTAYLLGGSASRLKPHPLFDTAHYLRQVKDLGGHSPLLHYAASGGGNRVSPHPLFDAAWYLDQHPGVVEGTMTPLAHYIAEAGNADGMEPNSFFDSLWYARQAGLAYSRGSWVLRHYIGNRQVSPHALFDAGWYLETYPDVGASKLQPLDHFIAHGLAEGRSPHPLFSVDWCRGEAGDENKLIRYLSGRGARDLGSPHPLFDQRWYLAANPDVEADGIPPLYHYLRFGADEGRDPNPFFDTRWYLSEHADVAAAGMNPLAHYVQYGARELRDPAPFMNARWYANSQADDRSAKANPLLHFLTVGYAAGAEPSAAAGKSYGPVVEPDVYNAKAPLGGYLKAIGHDIRAVLAAEVLKRDPDGYRGWIEAIIARMRRNPLPATPEAPRVTVILPVYNGLHFSLGALASIAANPSRTPVEIIVIDNVSNDRTFEVMSDLPGIRYVRNEVNVGYLRSNNKAATLARGEFLFLLNNDTMVCPGWLDEAVQTFEENEGVGLIGSKLIYPDGDLQEAGGILWSDGSAWNYGHRGDPSASHLNYARQIDYASAAAVLVPRRLWNELDGFDEMYVPSYCEDSDLALRIRDRGYGVLYAPTSTVIHFEGMTQGRDTSSGVKAYEVTNTEKLKRRWAAYLATLQPNGQNLQIAKDRGVQRRVLFLDNCTPMPDEDAGSITVMNLMLLLKAQGFLVTFVPQDNYLYLGGYTRDMQRRGIEVLYGPYVTDLTEHLREFGSRYDLVVMYRPDSHTRHIDAVRTYAPQAKTIYHTCDLHFVRMQRQAELTGDVQLHHEAKKMKVREFNAMQTSDAVILHSVEEQRMLQPQLPDAPLKVFSWAIPVEGSSVPFEERRDLVFVGGYNHLPNVDAVEFFVGKVLPLVVKKLPDVVFHIIGSRPPESFKKLNGPNVKVHGFVPDILPLLEGARVSVAPLRYGAGVKGKIATAMSVGLPNVVSTIGAEGMNLNDGVDVLVADSPADMAEAVVRLYTDPVLWRRLSAASVDYAERSFGPTAALKVMDGILADIGFKEAAVRPSLSLISPTSTKLARSGRNVLRPLARMKSRADLAAALKSSRVRCARRRDERILADHRDEHLWTFPGWSVGAGDYVDFVVRRQAKVSVVDWGGQLVCPISKLDSRQRLALTYLQGLKAELPTAAVVGVSGDDLAQAVRKTFPKYVVKRTDAKPGKANATVSQSLDIRLEVASLASPTAMVNLAASGRTGIKPSGRAILSFSAKSKAGGEAVASGMDLVVDPARNGLSDAHMELFHSPEFGHIGDDLFILDMQIAAALPVKQAARTSRSVKASLVSSPASSARRKK